MRATTRSETRRRPGELHLCVSLEEMIAYAAGLLSTRERAAIELHLLTCAACLDRLREADATCEAVERADAAATASTRMRAPAGLAFLQLVRSDQDRFEVPATLAASTAGGKVRVELLEYGDVGRPVGRALPCRLLFSPSLEDGRSLFLGVRPRRPTKRLAAAEVAVVVATRTSRGRIQRGICSGRFRRGSLRIEGAPLDRTLKGVLAAIWILVPRMT